MPCRTATRKFDNFSDGNKSDKRITLIDKDGSVIADTEADAGSMNNHSDRAEFKAAQQNGSGISVRYSDTLTEKTVYYAKSLLTDVCFACQQLSIRHCRCCSV